jgi:hypothetical protein
MTPTRKHSASRFRPRVVEAAINDRGRYSRPCAAARAATAHVSDGCAPTSQSLRPDIAELMKAQTTL